MKQQTNTQTLARQVNFILRQLGEPFLPYKFIIKEVLREYGEFAALKGRQVVELGPGCIFRMIEFLAEFANVEAAGLTEIPLDPPDYLVEKYLLEYLAEKPENSVDLIYSRRVMESNSFEAPLLLKSAAYKRLRTEGPSLEVWKDYPGAKWNIIRSYIEARNILKPGGIIISHIGNRFMASFHKKLARQLDFRLVISYPVGFLGQIWVFRKPA